MPIALKSGKPVLKDTMLATTCSCCCSYPSEISITFGIQTYTNVSCPAVAQAATDAFSGTTYVLTGGSTSANTARYVYDVGGVRIIVEFINSSTSVIAITSNIPVDCDGLPGRANTYRFYPFNGGTAPVYDICTNQNVNPLRYPFFANMVVDVFPFFTFSR
jgi:hypothetical protein